MSVFATYAKSSFEITSKELNVLNKKKQAIDKLFKGGKISKATFDEIAKDYDNAIAEMGRFQKDLVGQVSSVASGLEQRLWTLEKTLVKIEEWRALGEIDRNTYRRNHKAILDGLADGKRGLAKLKEALSKITPKVPEAETPAEEKVAEEALETVQERETAPSEEAKPAETERRLPFFRVREWKERN